MSSLWSTFEGAPASGTVFVHEGTSITWADIRAAVARGTAAIADTSGTVYLHTRSAAAFLAALLACVRLGRPVVCPAHAGRDYLSEICSGEGVLVADTGEPCAVSLTTATLRPRSAEGTTQAPVADGSLPITFMTSGTTAAPKAVAKLLRELELEAAVLETLWGGVEGPVFATVSHQHIYGLLFRIFWPVLAGRSSAALQTDYWEQLQGCLGSENLLVTSPAHLSRLPDEFTDDLGSPRMVFSSGGPLQFADARACEARFGQLPVEVFGSTETGGIARRRQYHPDEAWTPFPGVEIDTDKNGCLSIRSPFTGQDEPVSTGDKAVVGTNGEFRVLGRADNIVKIEGKRVSLTRVENTLRDLPGVRDTGVCVLTRRALAAAVLLDADGSDELGRLGAFAFSRRLRKLLVDRLEPMERPKAWRFVDRILVNSQGKRTLADVRALFERAADLGGLREDVRYLGPLNAEVDLTLDGASVWFDGHFPEQPIFPGIAEVHLAVTWARQLWNWQPTKAHMRRLKFSRILQPEDRVRLVLERNTKDDTLHFRYFFDDRVAGEGIIGGNL